jgi:hypothetical protein
MILGKKKSEKGGTVNILALFCFLVLVLSQGCSQGHSATSSMKDKDDDFKKYVNSNVQQQEITNQQSNAIINVAF